MLEVWKSKIKAELPGHVWPYCDLDIRRHLFGGSLEHASIRLSKYYYFFVNLPKYAIIARQLKSENVGIHPGVCRFVGSCLRNEEIWLDSIIYIKNKIPCNPNIQWLEKIETIDNEDLETSSLSHYDKNDWELNNKEYNDLLLRDSRDARIEIVSELNEKIIFNPSGKWLIKESIQDHNGIFPTIKHIFTRIEKLKTY